MPVSMSREDDNAFREILQRDPECKMCFECKAANPLWCDVLHGTFICLDCSGIHRSLGVHLSFVRSSTMDSWSDWKPEKLRQMQIGGNRRARLYFEKYNVPTSPLKERYLSIPALRYAAMLEAEALQQPFDEESWQPPEWHSRVVQANQYQGDPLSNAPQAPQQHQYIGLGSQGSAPPHSSPTAPTDWLMSSITEGLTTVARKTTSLAQNASEAIQTRDLDDWKGSLSRGWGALSSTVATYATKLSTEAQNLASGLSGDGEVNEGYAPPTHYAMQQQQGGDERGPNSSAATTTSWGETVDVHSASSPSVSNARIIPSRVVRPASPKASTPIKDEWEW